MAIIFLRSTLLFLSLFVLMRLLGKRQLGQLEPSELVVSVLIADLGAHPLQDIGIPMLNGLVAIVTIFCLELVLSGMALRSSRLRAVLWGKPCFLIEKGVINQKEMRRNRFSLDELTEELRRKNVTDLRTVEYAVLETDGTLNVLLAAPSQPVTAGQMNISPGETGYPFILIDDGHILQENLRKSKWDLGWLNQQLKKKGAKTPEEVFLLMADDTGLVYYTAKEKSS